MNESPQADRPVAARSPEGGGVRYLARDDFVNAAGGVWQALRMVLEADLTNGQKVTLLSLLDADGPQLRKRIGRRRLAERSDRGASIIGRDLRDLQAAHCLTLQNLPAGGQRWLYRFPLAGAPCDRAEGAPSDRQGERQVTGNEREGERHVTGGGAHEGTSPVTQGDHDVTRNPDVTSPPNPQGGAVASAAPSTANGLDALTAEANAAWAAASGDAEARPNPRGLTRAIRTWGRRLIAAMGPARTKYEADHERWERTSQGPEPRWHIGRVTKYCEGNLTDSDAADTDRGDVLDALRKVAHRDWHRAEIEQAAYWIKHGKSTLEVQSDRLAKPKPRRQTAGVAVAG